MKTVREIIIANEKIYPHTDKRIQINRSRMNDLEFNDYANDLEESFYTQINEMIICLQSEKLMIQQVDKLKEQLIGMSEYFFNQMPFRTNNWDLAQSIDSKLIGKQGIYINPKDFTKEKVISIVQRLITENHNKEGKRDKKKTFDFWVELAIKMATDEVETSFKKNNEDWTKTTNQLFGKKYSKDSKPLKFDSVRNYMSQSHASNKKGLWAVKNKIEILEKAISIIKSNPNLEIKNKSFLENLRKLNMSQE